MRDMILAKVDRAKMLLAECRNASAAKKIADMAHAAEIYAKRQRASQETIDYAHGVKVDAMTLLGDFLEKQEKRGPQHSRGGGSKGSKREPLLNAPSTLKQAGITKKESALSQKLAKMARTEPAKHEAIRAAKLPLQSVFSSAHVSHNSGNNEWYTPKEFIKSAVQVMGGIDIDPASTEEANEVIGAKKFFTAEEDGLKQRWSGRVWMNPPYASELVGKFCEKLAGDFTDGNVSQAIVLVNNSTETAWFQALSSHAAAICFPRTRVKFWHPSKATASPLQGQAIIYLGRKKAGFLRYFKEFGLCCDVYKI